MRAQLENCPACFVHSSKFSSESGLRTNNMTFRLRQENCAIPLSLFVSPRSGGGHSNAITQCNLWVPRQRGRWNLKAGCCSKKAFTLTTYSAGRLHSSNRRVNYPELGQSAV